MRRTARATAAAGLVLLVVTACTPVSHHVQRATPEGRADLTARSQPTSDPLVRRTVLLGYSVDHRPIVAVQLGDPDSPRRVLVVGSIHGNEPAGIAIAQALSTSALPREVDLWVVLDLNPDGVALHRRGNQHGVDLNRNFPFRWRDLGPSGSTHYAGPRSLSEPESRIAAALVQRVRPTLGIWYHQALRIVDDSQGPKALEQRYAADTGLALQRLPDYPGSGVGYEDQLFGPTAFVVELPSGQLTGSEVARHVRAILDVAGRSAPADT